MRSGYGHKGVSRAAGVAALIAGLSLGCIGVFGASAQTVATPPSAAAPAASPGTGTAIAIMQATAALQAGKCDEALPALAQLWDDANLQSSDPELAEQFRFQRIVCTLQSGGTKAALELSTQNIARSSATISSYDLHVFLLLSDERAPEAADMLDVAMNRFPGDAKSLTDISVMATLLTLPDEDRRRALLAHLEHVHWQIHDASGRLIIDYLRLDGLRVAVAAHDTALAGLYRDDIAGDAYIYMLSQGDGSLSNAAAPALAITPIITKQIEDVKAHVAQNPDDLLGLDYLMGLERSHDDHQLALLQLNGILKLITEYGLDKFDAPNTYPTLITDKAEILDELGQPDDALAVYTDGAAHMRGPGTLSFTLSYMNFLIAAGQERTAVALESHIDFAAMDEDDKRELAATEACAYAYMQETVRYTQALNAATAPNGVVDVRPLLCAGDTEGAAKALIAMINDPDSRDEAIMTMQGTVPPIVHTPRRKAYIDAYQALKARPDVVAAAKAQNIIIRSWAIRY